MKKIKFIGWKVGMNKIEFIQLLYNNTSVSLTESKKIKDRIVDGEDVELMVDDNEVKFIVDKAREYGLIVQIEE